MSIFFEKNYLIIISPGIKIIHGTNFRRHQETVQNAGRERRKHRGWGDKERDDITRDRQGNGPPVKASRGGGKA